MNRETEPPQVIQDKGFVTGVRPSTVVELVEQSMQTAAFEN